MTAKKETKEVATKNESTDVATIPSGSWGSENAKATDMIVPRIQLLQKTSKMVEKEALNAKAGQFRDSLNERLLGDKTKPLKIIPIFMTNSWVVLDAKGNKFIKTMVRDATNEDMPFEATVDGKIVRNIKSLNVFCLLPEDIEKKEAFPFVLSFQATSFQAGRKLVTLVKKLEMMGKPLASKNFIVGCEEKENDKGKWHVMTIEQAEDTKPEHMPTAYQWYLTVSKGNVKVHEGAEDSGQSAPTGDTGEY